MGELKFWKIREFINLKLFRSKNFILILLRILSLAVSLVAVGSIIYFHGFPKTQLSIRSYLVIIHLSLAFYLLKFLIRFFLDYKPSLFIRRNRFEAIIMALILVEGFGLYIFDFDIVNHTLNILGLGEFVMLPILFVQVYFLLIVGIQAGRASEYIISVNVRPQAMLALSFMLLILGGAFLLMLPEMTVSGHISFVDSVFTSASASCVTGLIVVDTATFFTLKGKVVIMLLIQLGGLNIISFATFFATFYRNSASIKYKSLLKDFLSADQISESRTLLQQIFLFSLFFEVGAAILLFFVWDPGPLLTTQNRAFYALFHSVSAFNNAGFSLFTNNLWEAPIRYAYGYHIIIMGLIFFGGIGFMNMIHYRIWFRQKILKKQKWMHMNISAHLALITSLLLILAGALIFMLLEWNTVLKGYSFFGKVVTSLFQSVTTRTAGYNSVDFTVVSAPVLVFFIFLMYVGASPGGTGGGIKTTTFAIIFKSALATIRGEGQVVYYKRTIQSSSIEKAFSIALFSFTVIFISVFFLTITEPDKSLLSLMFEEFSAIGTVGLSTGITSSLSVAGKIIITLSMFIGRIGTLTMAILLTGKVISTNFKYAEEGVVVG
jgi:trk system potassium uptake protein